MAYAVAPQPFPLMTIIRFLIHEDPTTVALQFQPAMGQTLCSVFTKDAVNPTEFFTNRVSDRLLDADELEQVQAYCKAHNIYTHTLVPHIM